MTTLRRKPNNCYVAGPLFSDQDRYCLEGITAYFEASGITVYLPHRDGGDVGSVRFDSHGKQRRRSIFQRDLAALQRSDFVVCLLDGQDTDSGTSVELGIAFARAKPIFAVKTDFERRGRVLNNMVWGVCSSGTRIFTTLEDLYSAVHDALLR